MLGPPPLQLGAVASAHPKLVEQFATLEPLGLAATFGGLLTEPDLQSNCIRLEVLVHLAIATAEGPKKPSEKLISKAFSILGKGLCGRYEDPAEDVFVSSVRTPRGNFRILEGVWESAGFLLQRFANIVEAMPRRRQFADIRETMYSLLRLSDLLCERSSLTRSQLGNPTPADSIAGLTGADFRSLQRRTQFSVAEVAAAGISIEHLSEFFLDPNNRAQLLEETFGHSTLERYPIVWQNDAMYFVLPTGVSVAIRRYIIERLQAENMHDAFLAALAMEYGRTFSRIPLLGGRRGADIEFKKTANGILAGATTAVDRGRYLNLVFHLDTLKDFDALGFAGTNPDPTRLADDIDKWIDHTYDIVTKRKDFVDGLTVLVGCGVGRGCVIHMNDTVRRNWSIESISAANLHTLSCRGTGRLWYFWCLRQRAAILVVRDRGE